MKLNKRYVRSIKSNLSFYVSSTVLTVMTLLLFYMMNISGKAIWEFGDTFFETQNLEDAHFTTYLPIPENEIEKLKERYEVELEPQYYVNIETEGVTARIFGKEGKINRYDITVGEDSRKADEIILSEGYAVHNKIAIGDAIRIQDKSYTVTGYFQRPDYLYMLQNETDSYKNVTTFFLAYLPEDEVKEMEGLNCQYLVRYHQDNQTAFRKNINETYYMRSYLAAKENMRIDMVKMQAEMFVVMSYIILAIMPLIVVVLVSIVIKRKVESEQKMIGTLSALGYRKSTLMRHYAGFAMIPGILGGTLSALLAKIFAQPFGKIGLMDYEPMRIVCHLEVEVAIMGIILPTVFYVAAAFFAVQKLLKKDVVLLLAGNAGQSDNKNRNFLVKSKLSFRIKYALRSLLLNPARTFVVFLGIFLGSFITLLGYSLLDTIDYTKQNMIDEVGSFEYQYVLNELIKEEAYEGEAIVMSVVELTDETRISLIGTRNENPYLDLKNTEGMQVDLEDGYFVTTVTAMLNEIEAGDVITLCNPLTLEEKQVTIKDIIDNHMQNAIYTNMKNATGLLGIEEEYRNVIMSDSSLTIPEEKIADVMKKSDAKEQFTNISGQMDVMIYLVIVMGTVICVAAVYVAANMLVTENRGNISMLKVLGYEEGMINRIVLRVNHILVPVGILISIPLVFATNNMFMKFLASFMGMVPSPYIAGKSIIYTILWVGGAYFGSLLLLRRKVTKVDMVESLKGNRE